MPLATDGTLRDLPLTISRASDVPSCRRKREDLYGPWRAPPVATIVSRASFGLAAAFFFFLDDVLVPAAGVDGWLVAGGGVLPCVALALPLRLPTSHSAARRPTTTMATSHPRGTPRRGARRRSRWPGGAIGCSSTSLRRSWRSLYSSMRSLPSS